MHHGAFVRQRTVYDTMVPKEEPAIVNIQIRSRHTLSKVYNVWVEFSLGLVPVTGWYCQCKTGARVVGCSAHVASVLWYMGFERHHQQSITHLKTFNLTH